MSEEATPQEQQSTPPQEQAQQQQEETLLAGKFRTPEALAQGYNEIRGKLGMPMLPTDQPLTGEGGIFTNTQALERIYRDHETMLGQRKQAGPPAEAPQEPAEESPGKLEIPDQPEATPDDVDVAGILQKASLTSEDITQQWTENGKLTDDQYAAIKKAVPGVTNAMINQFIEYQSAAHQLQATTAQQAVTKAAEIAGGEQQLNNMLQWASDLPAPQKTDLNRRLQDPQLYQGAMLELKGLYEMQNGKSGMVSGGTSTASPSTAGFSTPTEMRNAMAESAKKFGSFDKDAALVQRLQNTPPHIRRSI